MRLDQIKDSNEEKNDNDIFDKLIMKSLPQINKEKDNQRADGNGDYVVDQPYAGLLEYIRLGTKIVTNKIFPEKIHGLNIVHLDLLENFTSITRFSIGKLRPDRIFSTSIFRFYRTTCKCP